MKKKLASKKLHLKKESIATLEKSVLHQVKGGDSAPMETCLQPCYSYQPERCLTGYSCDWSCVLFC